MFEIDEITIITGIILLVLTFATSLVNPYLFRVTIPRRPLRGQDDAGHEIPDKNSDQPVSIVITTHDEKAALERNLPLFLYQDYDSDFQVIVVAESL